MYPIVDLHCDLLSYLSCDPKRTPHDDVVGCSIPYLQKGNVFVQVMALFCETHSGSTNKGVQQVDIFRNLINQQVFTHFERPSFDTALNKTSILPAIENASIFAEEDENLEHSLERFRLMRTKMGKPLYISLTWNTENRFGGGAFTKVGLKSDGEIFLRELHQQRIAIDLSHASDFLCHDIFNYMEKHNLEIPVLASHSNMRAVVNAPRNLPDEFVKEIIERQGIIGLNFIRYLIGHETPDNFFKHVSHLIDCGGEKHVCFGADFFYNGDVSPEHRKPMDVLFFSEYGDASTYAKLLNLWKKQTRLNSVFLKQICHENFAQFIARHITV